MHEEIRFSYSELQQLNQRIKTELSKDRALNTLFHRRLDIARIFNHNMLEGTVLEYEDIEVFFSDKVITDENLTPSYYTIKNYLEAINYLRGLRSHKKEFTLEVFSEIHKILRQNMWNRDPEGQFRTRMPLHKRYFHSVVEPSKIVPRLKSLAKAINTNLEIPRVHPVDFSIEVHLKFLRIYPFEVDSGKIARILMNHILESFGYIPFIINGTERQTYYDRVNRALMKKDEGAFSYFLNKIMEHYHASIRLIEELKKELESERI